MTSRSSSATVWRDALVAEGTHGATLTHQVGQSERERLRSVCNHATLSGGDTGRLL
jgi:hypothetical protein